MRRFILLPVLMTTFVIGLAGQAQEANLLGIWQDTTLVGSNLHSNIYNEIWGYAINNHEYAIIGSTAGTHFIDVTKPSEPFEAFFVEGTTNSPAIIHRDYHDYKGFLYHIADEGSSSFQVMDMRSLPDTVIAVDNNSANLAHNLFVDAENKLLFLLDGFIEIFDISDPANPQFIRSYTEFGDGAITYFHDGYFQNNIAFLNGGGNGLAVIDFSDIHNPVVVNTLKEYPFRGYNHSGWVSKDGSTYYFADETHGFPLKAVDINDLCDLEVGTTFDAEVANTKSIPHNLIVACDYLYVSYYYDGLRVYDISEPMQPALVRFYDTYPRVDRIGYEGAWGVFPFLPSGNILVSDMQFGLHIFEGMGDKCSDSTIESPDLRNQICTTTANEDISIINAVNILPNPAIDYTSLIVNLSTAFDNLIVSLINVNGQLIKDWQYQNLVQGKNELSILLPNSLSEGVYFLSLRNEQFNLTKKLIIGR